MGDTMAEGRKAQDEWKEGNNSDSGFLRREMDRIRGILALRTAFLFFNLTFVSVSRLGAC